MTALPHGWLAVLRAYQGAEDAAHVAALDKLRSHQSLGITDTAVQDLSDWAFGITFARGNKPADAYFHLSRLRLPAMQRAAAIDRLEAAYRAGDVDTTRMWAIELNDFADQTHAAWAAAAAAHGLALCAGDEQAVTSFDTALVLHEAAPRLFDRARTQLAYGEFLRRHGRRADARPLLRAARQAFDVVHADPWAERATQELRACGETARPRKHVDAGRLTPQELSIAKLVKLGRSNRDVATELFISPRTVEYHLTNVYQKLGLSSRGDLVGLDL